MQIIRVHLISIERSINEIHDVFFFLYCFQAPGDSTQDQVTQTSTDEIPTPLASASDRRSSRDIGVQAFSLEIEEEKKKTWASQTEPQPPAKDTETKLKEFRKCKRINNGYDTCCVSEICVAQTFNSHFD